MDKEFWHQRWKTNEIGFNQSKPHKLMQRFFPMLNLPAQSRVFVPLCGQSIDMLWLAHQGYNVIGIELSQIACDAFFKDNHIPVNVVSQNEFQLYQSEQITIICGDFFKLTSDMLGKVDAIYDRAALVALPHPLRQIYSTKIIELMSLKAKLLLITTVYNQKEMQGPPFSINEEEVKACYGACFKITQVYSKSFQIPGHLKEKGLINAIEQAYILE